MSSLASGANGCARFVTDGPGATQEFASALAQLLVPGDLVVLTGDLGAGKTCLTQGLARGLDIAEPVTSPTFTLANRYHGRLTLHHLDVYRLGSEAEATDLAIEELLDDGVVVIEWGERIAGLLPDNRIVITLRYPPALDVGSADERLIAVKFNDAVSDESAKPDRGLNQALASWIVDDC